MKRILPSLGLALALSTVAADHYDFRITEAYRQLSATEKQQLQQVHRDLVLLWGALDMYADDHDGQLPATLDELAPKYLTELPSDPFAVLEKTSDTTDYVPSKQGRGYRFRKGTPGNRAWVICSVGLQKFPYLAERGNVGLYRCKGGWISGRNPAKIK